MLSQIAQEHVAIPRNAGRLESANAKGQAGIPGDGPYMVLWLQIEKGVIKRASYECNGCPSTIACASMTAQIITGRTLEQARSLTPQDLVLLLDGLPEGKGHCAEMALTALQNSLGGI